MIEKWRVRGWQKSWSVAIACQPMVDDIGGARWLSDCFRVIVAKNRNRLANIGKFSSIRDHSHITVRDFSIGHLLNMRIQIVVRINSCVYGNEKTTIQCYSFESGYQADGTVALNQRSKGSMANSNYHCHWTIVNKDMIVRRFNLNTANAYPSTEMHA